MTTPISMFIAIDKETKGFAQSMDGCFAFASREELSEALLIKYGFKAIMEGGYPHDHYDVHEIRLCTETQQIHFKGVSQ